MKLSSILRVAVGAGATWLACAGTSAAPLQYGGIFSTDDARAVLSFHLDAATDVGFHTTSYAQGGFAPILTLFGAPGGVQQDSGSAHTCAAGAPADPATGFCWDAVLDSQLGPGDYVLVLTQDGNYANGLAPDDGFGRDGATHYTAADYLGMPDGPLCVNVDGSQRSCAWSLVAEGLDAPAGDVPEPASAALSGIGLAALLLRRARRRMPS